MRARGGWAHRHQRHTDQIELGEAHRSKNARSHLGRGSHAFWYAPNQSAYMRAPLHSVRLPAIKAVARMHKPALKAAASHQGGTP